MRSKLLTAVLVASAVVATPAAAQTNANHESVVRSMFSEVWSSGSFEPLGTMLAPDFRFHFRGRAMPMDGQRFQGMVTQWRAAFPDLRMQVEDVVINGDRAAARLIFTGTQQGKMFGIEPTGRQVSVTMMAFFRFADGRIAELWEDYDEHGLRQQLTRPAQSD